MINLGRDKFREAVFARDSHRCVVPYCGRDAVDAHHIMDRERWQDEGYYLDNGVSLCERHHKAAEACHIPAVALRRYAKISNIMLPPDFDSNQVYDKWGNLVEIPNRQSWELLKYPHTPYLPFSPSVDQKDLEDGGYFDIKNLLWKDVAITIKLDGSNMMMTHEKITARNGHDATHKSFDMAKALHAKIAHKIPENVQVFGEWLYAKHSIHYTGELALKSLFQIFAVYFRDEYMWGGWSDVEEYASMLGFPTVPILGKVYMERPWEVEKCITTWGKGWVKQGHEGLVIRSMYPFHHSQFSQNVAKFVRANHVQTSEHWSQQRIVKNEVKND